MINGVLKAPFVPRLLKEVQMQGAAPGTRPPGWVPVRGVLNAYVAAPRERGGTHCTWVTADGPLSAAD